MRLSEVLAVLDEMIAEARERQQKCIAEYGQHGIFDFYYDGRATGIGHASMRLNAVTSAARGARSPRGWHVVADCELGVLG